ncbi:MAG TPA: hypothetical protein VF648_00120 [Pyrinomonadaceae bacterium]|jgi:hypothetical protein
MSNELGVKNNKASKLKRLIRGLRKTINEKIHIDPKDIMAVAGIHGTIFSIIIGFLSAYGLYIYNRQQELEIQVLQEASKINTSQIADLSPSLYFESTAEPLEEYTITADKRKQILNRLAKYCMGVPVSQISEKRRASEITRIFHALYTQFPFKENNGPISFDRIEKVRNWIIAMDETLPEIDFILLIHGNTCQKYLDTYINNEQFPIKYTVQAYLKTVTSAKEIVDSTKSSIAQYEAQQNARKYQKRYFILALIISIVGLVFGVLLPILNKRASTFLYVLIPIVCYIFLFSIIIFIFL